MISVVILSLSAAFATDDADDVIAIDDEINSCELLTSSDNSVVSANESVSNDVIVINHTNIHNYIDKSGYINETVTADELIFNGGSDAFNNLNLTLSRPIIINGNNSILINPNIIINSSNVILKDFVITQNKNYPILLTGLEDSHISDVTVSGLTLQFADDKSGNNAIAIQAINADNFKLLNNIINYVGNTNGSYTNNIISISNSDNTASGSNVISGNKINASLVSCYVPWINWVSFPVSEAIVIENSNYVNFVDNDVNVTYNDVCGSYDTIYSIDFKNVDYATITGNNITSKGYTYIYGIIISGNNFVIDSNKIISSGDYYANGIDVEGPATGVIENNDIYVEAETSAYGIYSGMNYQNVTAKYEHNNISGNAYNIFAFSLGDVGSDIVSNNINITGNYTTGIAYSGYNANFTGNSLFLNSSEEGNLSVWESFGVEAVGIKVIRGNVNIADNTIIGSGKGIYLSSASVFADLKDNNINITAEDNKDAYAIYANEISKLIIYNNTVNYQGKTKGTGINNAVYINKITNASINLNTFELSLVSSYVPWSEIPAGSYNYVSFPVSEGIVIADSTNIIFDGNKVNVGYNDIFGSYDTIYSVDFKNSNNAVISNNKISSNGYTYIYGIIISGDNFTIDSNNITSSGDYYANGIDIEGPADGVIKNNNINVKANTSAYAIYSGMNGQAVKANYYNNTISGNAYNFFAMSIGDVESNIVSNNIDIAGNYTTGIAYRGSSANFTDNLINLNSSEIGTQSVWESFGVEAVGIKVISGNVNIAGNDITGSGKGIYIASNSSTADLKDNTISITAKFDKDAFGVYVDGISELSIFNNTVIYVGATNGTGLNDAVLISNAKNVEIKHNLFDFNLVSSYVSWIEIPAGSYNYVSFPVSEGIVIADSTNITFDGNTVTADFNNIAGSYDTIYSVDIKNSNNVLISNNNIDSRGYTYIYSIIISGNNFTIDSNNITSSGDYYANGIDVEGPADGVIKNNNIISKANRLSYTIYGAMSNGDVVVDIINNKINGNAYLVYGIQMGGNKVVVENNNINASGNYTIGIGARVNEIYVNNNVILSNASNEGNLSIWDSMGSNTEGILIKANDASIKNNNVETTGNDALNLGDSNAIIKNNNLKANNTNGSAAVNSTGYVNELVEPTALKAILIASDLTKVYGDKDQYVVTLLDENGRAIADKTVTVVVAGKTLECITDNKGVVKFDMDLEVGNYTVETIFGGTVVYAPKNITSDISVTQKETAFTAPDASVLVSVIQAGYTYKITLNDGSGNALTNKNITISFNGKTEVLSTDVNGVVNYKLLASKAGSQKLTVTFAGDNNYLASTATATVKISKDVAKFTASKKTYKIKVKTKKYSVILKDSKGNAIKNAKVTIKVKGKTYKATTAASGKATFKITKLTKKGTFSATVKFAGNDYYEAASQTVKITVKK